LVCAVALIETERGSGTGFFIDGTGEMVTAAHVVSQKNFHVVNGQIDFDVAVDKKVVVTPNGGHRTALESSQVGVDKLESSFDLTLIRTNIKPPCWIPVGDDTRISIGEHLLSVGFPGIDNGNPILYEGFLSGRFRHPPNTVVAVVNGQPIRPSYEVLKVQMPVTPGASGSPIVDDAGEVVGVISEAPMVWTEDLEKITRIAGVSSSGVTLSGFDVTKTLGQLALVVREFESPGSAYAVPISDLNSARAGDPKPATPSH
jgi:S1-C subfamily serine protease